jgi:hypothetical protein
MKDKVDKIIDLIQDVENMLELSVLNEIKNNKNFNEVTVKIDDSIQTKKLNLEYEIKRKPGRYTTVITDSDNESLKLLRLTDVGGAKQDIAPKAIFSKLKKDIIKKVKSEININKVQT